MKKHCQNWNRQQRYKWWFWYFWGYANWICFL